MCVSDGRYYGGRKRLTLASVSARVRPSPPILCAWLPSSASTTGFFVSNGTQTGAAAVVVLWFVLWRGVGARPLTLLAGALLGVVVPILYLTASGDENAGNQAFYVIDHNTANWVGVAAIGLLMIALWRTQRDRYVLGRSR